LSVQRYNSEAVLQSLLSDPTTHKPPRIISSVQRLRPPVYSPEIIALLTSPQARRKGKTLELSSLESPPILPVRADPAQKKLESTGLSVNVVTSTYDGFILPQYQKISLPIEISVRDEGQAMSGSQEVVGARGIGLQGAGVLREVQEIAGHSQAPPSHADSGVLVLARLHLIRHPNGILGLHQIDSFGGDISSFSEGCPYSYTHPTKQRTTRLRQRIPCL